MWPGRSARAISWRRAQTRTQGVGEREHAGQAGGRVFAQAVAQQQAGLQAYRAGTVHDDVGDGVAVVRRDRVRLAAADRHRLRAGRRRWCRPRRRSR